MCCACALIPLPLTFVCTEQRTWDDFPEKGLQFVRQNFCRNTLVEYGYRLCVFRRVQGAHLSCSFNANATFPILEMNITQNGYCFVVTEL